MDSGGQRAVAFDAAALGLLRVLGSLVILRLGFSHISDDDYARTVIAERFAAAPTFDPSHTSWLPSPFWITGGAMVIFGRTLSVARGVALVASAASAGGVYAALRISGAARGAAAFAVLLAALTPWSMWLGAAPVPEGFTGALLVTACILTGAKRAPVVAGALLFAATLARYEAWPVALVVGSALAISARRDRRVWTGAFLAIAGPVAWMAWNRYSRGDPFEFVARVQRFRVAFEGGDLPLYRKLVGYPLALVTEAPELALFGTLGLSLGMKRAEFRQRYGVAIAATGAMLAFLIWGDVHDGAPTHHPIRALTSCLWLFAACGVDGILVPAYRACYGWPKRESYALGGVLAAAFTWMLFVPTRWHDFPGQSGAEDRAPQLARGEELRRNDPAHLEVTPCAYEHFALLAAFGAPERATIQKETRAPVGAFCPAVTIR